MIGKKANLYCIPLKHAPRVECASGIVDVGVSLVLDKMPVKGDTIVEDGKTIPWYTTRNIH